MIRETHYEPCDVFLVKAREIYEDRDPNFDNAYALHPGSVARTLWIGDVAIAVMCISIKYPGVADAWAVISDSVKLAPKDFHTWTDRFITTVMESNRLWRVQISVRSDYQTGNRWMRALRFNHEATLKYLGPKGHHYNIWAKWEEKWLPPQ